MILKPDSRVTHEFRESVRRELVWPPDGRYRRGTKDKRGRRDRRDRRHRGDRIDRRDRGDREDR